MMLIMIIGERVDEVRLPICVSFSYMIYKYKYISISIKETVMVRYSTDTERKSSTSRITESIMAG